jgi:enoyl-[acyl-carrier-protein] reductase (NADH)
MTRQIRREPTRPTRNSRRTIAKSGQRADEFAYPLEIARQTTGETIFVDGGMHISTPR